jgi:predicted amidophosphoribosyltransferase
VLAQYYEIDENLADPEPENIAVFDDILTTGTHFRAAKRVLSERFPNARIFGFFIARRVPWSDDI